VTISKGQDWGEPATCPGDVRVVRDNVGLFRLLATGDGLPRADEATVGLAGGDLARTVGAPDDPARFRPGSRVSVATVDLGVARHDAGVHTFAAHAVLHGRWWEGSWWRGPIVAVMNAQFIGRWDVASRSHPNDGWLDVTELDSSMSLRQRVLAARRLPTAGHVPHPDIRTRRVRRGEWAFERPMPLWLDGEPVGATRNLEITVVPDALPVCF
jgi:hypothetical protein